MDDVLTKIVTRKRERLASSKRERPISELRKAANGARLGGRLREALQRNAINVIAEVKRRSPSKGIIRANFDPVTIAENYTRGDAAAISILTEEDFFDGSLDHLRAVRAVTPLPLLRKDFIFDEYQLLEAVEAGADAILLIAAMLEGQQVKDLLDASYALGLDVLVEVHDRAEAESVLRFDVRVLGVNNRNLRTFVTDLETSIELAPMLPDSLTLVSESGIRTRMDIERLREAGYSGFLIGEELMRSGDESTALRELIA